jgi:3-deoxy-D-manno-octulosonic acid kinase
MTPSESLAGNNLTVTSFTIDGQICSVYTSACTSKLLTNQFLWPQIIADLLVGAGLDELAAESGRGGIFFFSDSRVPQPVVIRQYRHGGFWRFISGPRFFSRKRFLTELKLHHQVTQLGIPVPAAVAVIVIEKEHKSIFVNGYFATLRLPDCFTLPEFLETAASRTRLMIFFKVGKYLQTLHENGIFYADMQVKNILVTASAVPYFIDFDKSQMFEGPLSVAHRRANLKRFLRSLEKFSERGGRLTESDRVAFLLAYASDSKSYSQLFSQLQGGLFWRRLFYRLGWLLNRS